jgi:drug/metabolite transporter (DMT)-like permease
VNNHEIPLAPTNRHVPIRFAARPEPSLHETKQWSHQQVNVVRYAGNHEVLLALVNERRSRRIPMLDSKLIAILVTIAFSVIGVAGDYFLKLASQEKLTLQSRWFYVGFALYASTAFGWVFVMKHLKLATISVLYSMSMVVLLTAIGVVAFRESLSYYELAGLAMAIGSLVLLMRFA